MKADPSRAISVDDAFGAVRARIRSDPWFLPVADRFAPDRGKDQSRCSLRPVGTVGGRGGDGAVGLLLQHPHACPLARIGRRIVPCLFVSRRPDPAGLPADAHPVRPAARILSVRAHARSRRPRWILRRDTARRSSAGPGPGQKSTPATGFTPDLVIDDPQSILARGARGVEARRNVFVIAIAGLADLQPMRAALDGRIWTVISRAARICRAARGHARPAIIWRISRVDTDGRRGHHPWHYDARRYYARCHDGRGL